ncbi:MAG: glycosyltransferase [Candidatus Pacebacteria bacterium]|jgi:glycosyltransferase involved in cell wall biosynthesis|nr:glycosyltransferase [Candidatus Paceibacterota bacterium]
MKKRKILVIGTTEKMGGAAGVSWKIAENLRQEDFWIRHMVGYKKDLSNYVYQFKQPKIIQKIDSYTRFNVVSHVRLLRSYILANDISFGVTDELLQHPWYKQANIIHFHNLHGSFFNLKKLEDISRDKSVVWTLHDMWSFTGHCTHSYSCDRWKKGCGNCPNLKISKPVAWDNTASILKMKEEIYQNSKLNIVVPSQWLYKKLDNSILSNQPRHLIHNGVNTNIFTSVKSRNAKEQLQLPINKKIILFVAHGGKSNTFKGGKYLDILTKAYKSNSEIFFVCIGAKRKKTLQENNIIYLPYIKKSKNLSLYFSASDLFLFTSQAENFPLVLLEALSGGIPILCFGVGGVPEIIEHKVNGYISKRNNETDLLKGANYLLNMKQERLLSMRKNNRKKAIKHFSVEKMVNLYKKLYEQI